MVPNDLLSGISVSEITSSFCNADYPDALQFGLVQVTSRSCVVIPQGVFYLN